MLIFLTNIRSLTAQTTKGVHDYMGEIDIFRNSATNTIECRFHYRYSEHSRNLIAHVYRVDVANVVFSESLINRATRF